MAEKHILVRHTLESEWGREMDYIDMSRIWMRFGKRVKALYGV